MLSFVDDRRRFGRRELLRVGGLALGGLTLGQLLASRAAAAQSIVKDRSVILLFLHGGPSQFETFDPKMSAPSGIRSVTGECATALPGVTFGSTYTKLAKLANRMSIVRSYAAGNANHDIKPMVCEQTLNANMGSLYSSVVGTNHPATGMPTNALLVPRSVDPSAQAANLQFGKFASTGNLGTAYAPFQPGAGGPLQSNMQLKISPDRLDDRRQLLAQLDGLRRHADATGAMEGVDRFRQQAFDTIIGGVADAFDLSKEDPKTIARYDTSRLVGPQAISRKWNNYNNYVDHGKTLGKLLLLARRLCEAGCGFVTVTTNFVWDNHADVNNADVVEGMRYCGLPLDHAVSAFMEDVRERGLDERILLVVTGEMGRTPKVNKRGGRDHWGRLTPLMLTGGGLKMGRVVGQSTRDAGEPATEPISISNLVATVMHTLFDTAQLRLDGSVPSDVSRIILGTDPIKELV